LLTDKLDLYCERLGPGLLAEPLNALSNAAFFVAAGLLWRLARREEPVLIALICAIGVSSALFHTVATAWARWLDIGSILVFQLAFLWRYARGVFHWRVAAAAAFVAAFLAVALYARTFPQLLGGSLMYAPAIAALVGLAALKGPGQPLLAGAAAIFALSLTLRTLDEPLCAQFPPGTHFFWHLLNPVVLYLCVRALVAAKR